VKDRILKEETYVTQQNCHCYAIFQHSYFDGWGTVIKCDNFFHPGRMELYIRIVSATWWQHIGRLLTDETIVSQL